MNNLISRNFTQIPNALINDPKLSRDARFLFVYLCSKPHDWKYYVSTIQKDLNCSKDTRLKYMKELTEAGWITVKQKVKGDGTFGANEIQLNPQPNFSATVEVPQPKKSAADNLGGGKSSLHSNTNNSQILNSEETSKQPAQKAQAATPKEQQEDLFGKKPNANKTTLFKNSAYFEIAIFEKKLSEHAALGVDIEYYHRQINNWSEASNKKRTARGWVATARTWMERDKDKKQLRLVKTDEQIMKSDADMQAYLKM